MKKKTLMAGATGALAALLMLSGCGGTKDAKASSADKDKFHIVLTRRSDWGKKFAQGFINDSAKKNGIDLDWEIILNSDWGTKKPAYLSSGKLPDAFMAHSTLNDQDVVQNKAVILKLDDYVKDMPNLQRAFKEDPSLKALCTSTDGHIYSLPSKLAPRPKIGNQLFINKKWLDKLGLKMPDTYDEFLDVLRAFHDKDPNGNGKKDEIPYGGGAANARVERIMNFALPFGVLSPFVPANGPQNITLDDGVPTFQPTTDRFKTAMIAMHKAMAEGLIDSRFFTDDGATSMAKKQAKTPIVGVAVCWTAETEFGQNGDQYVALPPLKGPDGNRYINSDPTHLSYNRNELVVTKNAAKKDVKKLMAWADSFYTDEASVQTFYGSFGIGTKKLANGNVQILEPKTGNSSGFSWEHSLRDDGMKFMSPAFEKKLVFDKNNTDYKKLAIDKQFNKYALPAYPNLQYTAQELKQMARLQTDINTYVSQCRAKWIMKGGVEAEWAGFKKRLDQMGLKDYMKIQQTAYDRWIKSSK
ncbi:extracellular solute-binding protein [Lacticaseibacillus mingshuiensis]|uniref:extracellular solute-binding protein n=1 Tax=Lacticaseibacillus mingshuiensis TaxID=2799574 RepID=UPI0019523623|nr:extracellular solute-binding protein [Lacticaseibacillus mingshuiensis]